MGTRRARKRSMKFKLLLILAFGVGLIYTRTIFAWVAGNNCVGASGIAMINVGEIEKSVNTLGYIVRDEETIKTPFKGKYVTEISDSERVQANQKVATVLKDSSEELLKQLKAIDEDILRVQQSREENKQLFSADVSKIDSEIGQDMKHLITASNNNSMVEVSSIKANIGDLIDKKVEIVGGFNTSDTFLSELKNKKSKLQDQISLYTKELTTSHSGLVSYSLDGYEELLKPSIIPDLDADRLDKIKPKSIKRDTQNMLVDADVQFAKVIKGFEYFVVVCLSEKSTENIKIDDNINIRINEIDKVIDGVVDYKSNIQSGKCVVAIKTDKAISETSSMRVVNVDLIVKYVEGFKVPTKSLVNFDRGQMKAQIESFKLGYKKPIDVKVLEETQEYAIIENESKDFKEGLNLYDTFIVDPKNYLED